MKPKRLILTSIVLILILSSCSENIVHPKEIIDLSPTITEDMKVRLLGHALLSDLGIRDSVKFEHFEGPDNSYFLDSYITLFNHAGPHADAPAHLIKGGSTIDEYKIDQFYGKAKYLDFSNKSWESPITLDEIRRYNIKKNEIVIVNVGFFVPEDPDELPAYSALSADAANYLAELPVKAYATDAPGVDNLQRAMESFSKGESALDEWGPVHHAFLSRGVPLIEGLYNIDALNEEQTIVFVGFPLKTTGKSGDGAPMRAAAFIY